MHHYYSFCSNGVFVCKGRMNMKKLVCPKCGRELMDISGESYIEKKCVDCNRLIIFNPETGITKAKKMPQRNTISGCRFYG
jgi:phage FluMu protein Com